MPWSSQIIAGESKGSYSTAIDMVVIEQNKVLIGLPVEQAADAKILGFVRKGSFFEPLVEINNTVCFQMSPEKAFSVDKSLLHKNK